MTQPHTFSKDGFIDSGFEGVCMKSVSMCDVVPVIHHYHS